MFDFLKKRTKEKINLEAKPFILITGMHRSGTSFLARTLNLAGVYLGDIESFVTHDWLSHSSNLRGNWENIEFLQLGEKTLNNSNGTWKSVPDRITINEQIGKEINESVKKLTKHPSLMTGFKDPRILLCLEAWKPFLPENIFIFGTFRHPLKVAESLKLQSSLSYQHSLGLWKIYNQKLLEFLEKYNGFLVNFDWPKEKMLSELNSILNRLGLSNAIDLSEWYTDELIRSDKTYESTFEIPDDINQIYSKLLIRSQSNDQIKVKTPHHTKDELKETINGLLSELQTQGIYFKKVVDNNLHSQNIINFHMLESSIKEKDSQLKKAINAVSILQAENLKNQSLISDLQSSLTDKDSQMKKAINAVSILQAENLKNQSLISDLQETSANIKAKDKKIKPVTK